MFGFDKFDLQRLAVSSVGAVVLSAACIGAAVAPANAEKPAMTVDRWSAAVENQIGSYDDNYALQQLDGGKAEAVLAVRFDAAGKFAGADIARSTGKAALDRHAVNVASRIRYPALPEGYAGKPQTVAMRLVFGQPDSSVQYAQNTQKAREIVRFANAGGSADTVAAK